MIWGLFVFWGGVTHSHSTSLFQNPLTFRSSIPADKSSFFNKHEYANPSFAVSLLASFAFLVVVGVWALLSCQQTRKVSLSAILSSHCRQPTSAEPQAIKAMKMGGDCKSYTMKKKKRTKTLPAALYTTKKTEEEVASKTQHRHHKKRLKKSSQAELNIIITKKTVVGFFIVTPRFTNPMQLIMTLTWSKSKLICQHALVRVGMKRSPYIFLFGEITGLMLGWNGKNVNCQCHHSWLAYYLTTCMLLTCILSYDLHATDFHVILWFVYYLDQVCY